MSNETPFNFLGLRFYVLWDKSCGRLKGMRFNGPDDYGTFAMRWRNGNFSGALNQVHISQWDLGQIDQDYFAMMREVRAINEARELDELMDAGKAVDKKTGRL